MVRGLLRLKLDKTSEELAFSTVSDMLILLSSFTYNEFDTWDACAFGPSEN